MDFEDWWRLYPRKAVKHMARKEWDKLTDQEKARAFAVIPLQARAWVGKEMQFIPHARTWLYQKRFLDDEFEAEKTQADKWMEALYGHGAGSEAAIRRVQPSLGAPDHGQAVAGGFSAGGGRDVD